MLFSRGLRWVFTQRRGVSLETGKQDPLDPDRNLDTQRGVCRLGHLSSRSQTRCSKNEVTKTQGGLEVYSIAAAKRKGNPAPYQASTVALPPQVSASPSLQTCSEDNVGQYQPWLLSATSHVSGAWLGFLCPWLFRTFRFVLPLPSALQKPKLKEAK